MRLEQRYSAGRLASIALWGSAGIFVAVVAMALPAPFPIRSSKEEYAWYLSLFVLAVVAGAVTYRVTEAFKRGVADELWPQPALDLLYAKLDLLPRWAVMASACAVLAIALTVITLGMSKHGFHGMGGLIYFWLSPFWTWGALKTAIRPRPNASGPSIWTTGVKPIQSEHWGER